MTNPSTVSVETQDGTYDVLVGSAIAASAAAALPNLAPAARRIALVVDDNLPEALVETFKSPLRDYDITELPFHASERNKMLASLERDLLVPMTGARLDRKDILIALGGGIVGDVAGLAAALYRRGISVIQCPTTLLAMVDAAVGGKTAVNLELRGSNHASLRKNMAGIFHQPKLVVADIDSLASLDPRDFRAGIAECLKHALIAADWGDPDLFDWTLEHRDRILSLESKTLTELIHRNVSVKARVVAADERELDGPGGGRALLNLGHTFGHAIEGTPSLAPPAADPPLRHGEAVAWGVCAAARCAAARSLITEAQADQIEAAFRAFDLPTRLADLPPTDTILSAMWDDKKVLADAMRLILPCGPRTARIFDDVPADLIRDTIDSGRA